ncbi:putative membrane protein [Marinobacterium sediminicola]|uniref:Membrane protein n=2 Tax=Marinobacterium sediminicola TaxID=518898 RepID=A0ABY1RYQ8_9GAMM|nr:putative membrane protein [Marinobacterium sediminicola]
MWAALWLIVYLSVFVWSAWQPADLVIWFLEVLPAILALLILALTRQRFPLTPLVYLLLLAHCVILMVGGHYTYAEVPLFDYLRDLTGGIRNNYDKLGHFAQGFVPALVARELIIRLQLINGRLWSNFFILCFCLAVSAFYELIEWWVALLSEEAAESFLGTQGYVWDTQSDMGWALFGAFLALLLLGRWHDRQIRQLSSAGRAG